MSAEKYFPFTTIHGIDGSGKTTIVSELVDQLSREGYPAIDYETYASEKVDNPISKIKRKMIKIGTPEAQFYLFLTSTIFHTSIINQLRKQGFLIVKDRWFWDVQAHHEFLGVKNTLQRIKQTSIIQPNLAVVLTIEETERQKRVLNRGKLDEKDKDSNIPGTRAHFFEQFILNQVSQIQSPRHGLIVDTTHNSPPEVAKMIINYMKLQQLLNNK